MTSAIASVRTALVPQPGKVGVLRVIVPQVAHPDRALVPDAVKLGVEVI